VIDPLDLVGIYGIDPVRFYVARAVSFGQDGSVSLDSLHERYEKELGNDLGNLLSRTTAMLVKYRDGRIPPAESLLEPATLDELRATVAGKLDVFDITGALDAIWDLVRQLNKLVTDTKPWELAKDEANAAKLDRVLYTLADGLRAVAVALAAYLPETSPRILDALGQADDLAWESVAVGKTVPADGLEAAQPLFPRLEAPATAA
jgi:methionyl-tRNA synthetase